MDRQHAEKCKYHVPGNDCTCDGHHTFAELYDHRFTLYIALCRLLVVKNGNIFAKVWRSKIQSDGTMPEGWFIMGISKEPGEQITYHLPLSRWDETDFAETLDRAPEWTDTRRMTFLRG